MAEEEAVRKRHERENREKQKKEKFDSRESDRKVELVGSQKTESFNDLKFQEHKVEIKSKPSAESAESKRRKKEKSDLHIDEGTALKEMSKLYRDLLERFEELRQKQEAQKTESFNDLKFQEHKVEIKSKPSAESAESKRRKKEKSDLHIDEGTALKEMSKLYRDLLERFEELRQKQEAQMSAESDSTRLRRLARKDPSVTEALHDVIEAIKKAIHDFKTCANLAGAMLPNATLHERELSHILLELQCASIHE
ncbi:hypothetical protein COOONC_10648 [Cooperia oncophora]